MSNDTTSTVAGYAGGYQDQAGNILTGAEQMYNQGGMGQTAGFNQTQLDAQQAALAASGVQTGLEGQLAGMAGQTDLSGMRLNAQNQAQQALGLSNSTAGRGGTLGGSRGFVNNQSIANNLASQFGQIDLLQQQQDIASTQAALNAQGTGAAAAGAVGLGQQQQTQNQLDSPFKGLTQYAELFSALAPKQTTAAEGSQANNIWGNFMNQGG